MKEIGKKIQIIDTPGLLDRPILDMNEIELNAMVALEHLADAIFFIIDVSETCGFSIESQFNLSYEIKRIFDVPMVYLFNKIDIADVNKDTNDKSKFESDESESDISYLSSYLEETDDYLFISAYEGKGIEDIISKLSSVRKIERNKNEDMEFY